MLQSLKRGGVMIFTLPDKYLEPSKDFDLGYAEALRVLTKSGEARQIYEVSFTKSQLMPSDKEKNNSSKVYVYQKS